MKNDLLEKIKQDIKNWRQSNYKCNFDEVEEILNFQFIDEEKNSYKFLRKPQFEAIETYLYLRIVKQTKTVISLYKEYFEKPYDLFQSLNIHLEQKDLIDILSNGGIDKLFEIVKNDNDFVKKYKLETLQESLLLDYPSYIFSLVMGAGKTILIGAIIFIEFALSLITKSEKFLRNALVFAPGKTIIGSLKEISFIDLDLILPKRFSNILKNNLKITYTQDGQKNIPILEKSQYNIIVTNIEKIRILDKQTKQKEIFNFSNKISNQIKGQEKQATVNLRLKQIASLKNLGIFSDEAHNTYGQKLNEQIKKVRQTINYLADKTDLKIVVNTTGTPYFKKQILKDVVFWYGLMEGIEENILKDVRGNIYSYSDVRNENFIGQVLDDFFTDYKDIRIEGGYRSKIAFYFPKIEDVKKIKPFIEKKVTKYNLSINSIFEVNSKSSDKDKDIFINKINDKNLPYRIFLLVGMGKEGWNCPSLFACCLARDLGNSNNFVLQASTRCLRQIVNNSKSARIYLSEKNTAILDKQLQETYGETVSSIQKNQNKFIEKKITLIKYDDKLPQIEIKRKRKKYFKKQEIVKNIKIIKPEIKQEEKKLIKYDFSKIKKGALTEKEILDLKEQNKESISLFEATQKLVNLYSLDYFEIFNQLKFFYENEILLLEFIEIKKQIEEQIDDYEVKEEEITENLTIIKKDGFKEEINEEGVKIYTTKIFVHKEKLEELLKSKKDYSELQNLNDLSFHYNPYKFDSNLEVDLFEFILQQINEKKENIKDFLFIGGITDKRKTDLVFEYRDKDGILRNYTPDFLIIKQNNEMIFLETKGKHLEENFKIKEKYFKKYLTDKIKFKLMVSDDKNINEEDKEYIQNKIINE